jgi:hypothetical protein
MDCWLILRLRDARAWRDTERPLRSEPMLLDMFSRRARRGVVELPVMSARQVSCI